MNPLADLKTFIDASGVSSVSWPVRLAILNTDSAQAIYLSEAGGFPFDTLGRENINAKFQLLVRGPAEEFEACLTKWQEVFDLLQDAQDNPGSPALLPGWTFIQCINSRPNTWWDSEGRACLTTEFRYKKAR